MKKFILFSNFFVLAFFLGCEEVVPTKDNILDPTNPDYEFSSLSGTVSNDRNNDLIPNASIVLNDTDTTVSNSDGYYSFSNIIHGEHEIITTKDSFLIGIDSIYIQPSEDKTYAISLSKDAPFLIISDTVFSVSPLESNIYFRIINDGVRILDYTIDNNNESLTSFPENGSISPKDSATIQLSINKHLLNEGISNLSFLINSNAGSKTIGLNVMVEPALQILTNQLLFDFNEPSAEIKLCNPGGGNLEFSIEENSDWITLSHYSGIISADTVTIYAYADTSNLVYGYSSSVITINHSNETSSLDCNIYSPFPASLQLSTQALDFGLDQEQLTFNIINSGDDILSWNIEGEQEFLSISQLSGQITESQTITISVDRSAFYEGNYSYNLTLNSNGGEAIVNISFDVLPILSLSEQTINLGSSLDDFSFSIQNTGTGILTWTIENNASWIEILSESEGELTSDPYIIEGIVNRDELSGGNYSSNIMISYGQNTQSFELHIYAPYPPLLTLSDSQLNFNRDNLVGELSIGNGGEGELVWSISENIAWLSVYPAQGTTQSEEDDITITIDPNNASSGQSSGNIVITSNGGEETVSASLFYIDEFFEDFSNLSGWNLSGFNWGLSNSGNYCDSAPCGYVYFPNDQNGPNAVMTKSVFVEDGMNFEMYAFGYWAFDLEVRIGGEVIFNEVIPYGTQSINHYVTTSGQVQIQIIAKHTALGSGYIDNLSITY